jgi:hypothetical protein
MTIQRVFFNPENVVSIWIDEQVFPTISIRLEDGSHVLIKEVKQPELVTFLNFCNAHYKRAEHVSGH